MMMQRALLPLGALAFLTALVGAILVGGGESDSSTRVEGEIAAAEADALPPRVVRSVDPPATPTLSGPKATDAPVAPKEPPPTTVLVLTTEVPEEAPEPAAEIEKENNVAPAAPNVAAPAPPPIPPLVDLSRPTVGPGGLALNADAPDPALLVVNGVYHLFSTNTGGGNVPHWTSTNLNNWQFQGDALPNLPPWAAPVRGLTWAPAVANIGGTYTLYFTSRDAASGRQCIGVATAASVAGPYQPNGGSLVCPAELGGAIDPDLFTDRDGSRHLIYKNDGNCCRIATSLWSVPLTGNGQATAGAPRNLLTASANWEGSLIEGADMVERNGRYHLFYSGNWWLSSRYAIGHAVCDSVAGPCYRTAVTPFMGNRANVSGVGGPSVWVSGSGEVWITYHGWVGGIGYPNAVRGMFLHRLDFPDWSPPPPPPQPAPAPTTTTTPSSTTTSSTVPSSTTTSSTTTSSTVPSSTTTSSTTTSSTVPSSTTTSSTTPSTTTSSVAPSSTSSTPAPTSTTTTAPQGGGDQGGGGQGGGGQGSPPTSS